MKNYNKTAAESTNPIRNRTNQTHLSTSARGRLAPSESRHLEKEEIWNSRTKKSNRTQFSVSKSVPVSQLMNEQRRIAQSTSLRVCGAVGFKGSSEGIRYSRHTDGSMRTSGVFVCKSACCVNCSSYKARLVFDRINPVVEKVKNKVFITLTTGKIRDLKQLNKGQKKALKSTIRAVKYYFKKYHNQEFGYVRSRETTFDIDNDRGLHYHPHFHLLFLNNDTDFNFEVFESKFREVWADRTEKEGLVSSKLAQKFIRVGADSEGLNHYLLKGLSHEMSGSAKKESKKGQSIYTLLAESSLGCKKSERIYKIFSAEFKGDKAVQTDNGFKLLERRHLDSIEEAEPVAETEVDRELDIGELSYKKLFKRYAEDFEDIIRHFLIKSEDKDFDLLQEVLSTETQNDILEDLGDYDRTEEDFGFILFDLFEEFLHKTNTDLRTLERRRLRYTRELSVVG